MGDEPVPVPQLLQDNRREMPTNILYISGVQTLDPLCSSAPKPLILRLSNVRMKRVKLLLVCREVMDTAWPQPEVECYAMR
jgi:hypothetical protein